MSAPIILSAFDMSCVTHQSPGLWRHPENQAHRYTDLDHWVELAGLLDRGGFDALFLADVLGVYDVYGGSAAAALRDSDQVPLSDPLVLVSALAQATEQLGFGVTVASTYTHPYALARTFTTLDHLTKGRIGWNVVTSYLESAARNLGLEGQIAHDERYEIAEEFLDVTYRLWEGSWEDGAVIRDRERGIYTDPAKVHPLEFEGTYFKVPGIHLGEPSPQRTPVIFQAGASPRGRDFAAAHGEAVFINGITPELTRPVTDDIRARAVKRGRPADSVKILTLATIVVADSDAEAERKHRQLREWADRDGALTLYGGWSGLDLSRFPHDEPLNYVDTDAVRSALSIFTKADPTRTWTPDDVGDFLGIGGIGPVIVGSPETVVDELTRWVEVGGVDGFNLAYALTPGTFEDIIDLVIPELRKRGLIPEQAAGGTLRSRLTRSDTVPTWHPAHQYRGAYVGRTSVADQEAAARPIGAQQ